VFTVSATINIVHFTNNKKGKGREAENDTKREKTGELDRREKGVEVRSKEMRCKRGGRSKGRGTGTRRRQEIGGKDLKR
jgi:hypothetical protein